jgi:N-acetylmuramoyl-L-alanine amidase
MKRLIILAMLFSWGIATQAGAVTVKGLRLWAAPDHTRLVFDTSDPVHHSLFTLKDPHRIVIDIRGSRLQADLVQPGPKEPLIERIRSASRKNGDLRIVLDLKTPVKPKSFVLKPNREYGHRLVIDLYDRSRAAAERSRPVVESSAALEGTRDVVIAIDAGHGGEDPGARGRGGTNEKDVVLAISRRLRDMINSEKGMRAVMIRDGDYYLGLRKRIEKARRHQADLFVSIHADAFRDSRVRGSSVFTLSRRGASSEAARWLAERENSADLVGGVKLEDKDDLLASVLLDLSQTATLQASTDVADRVHRRLTRVGKVHKSSVQQAGFVVLKSPDIPSILVETAFISNPSEERKLKSSGYQAKLAKAILRGIRDYFYSTPPPGTLLAAEKSRQHVISRGDTLSGIAQRYRVSLASLRSANGLKNDRILIGQTLKIPVSGKDG